MLSLFGEPSRRRFLLDTAIPILAVALLLNLLCAGLLYWSTKRADKASLERQQDLVELVLSRLVEGVAHDQESVTVWDDALNALREPGGKAWIEANLGSWMYTYFGHDASFIVDPDGELVLSSAGGKPADRSAFEAITHAASHLIQELRQKLADGNRGDISGRVLTPGAADISTVNGRPAAVSVKPIVSDSGQINIQPGREYLHVALRYIDKELVEELRADYLINGLRFAWTDDAVDGEVASRLRALGGEAVGYFIWIPYRPGSTVRAYMLPMLVALCGLSLLALTLLLGGLRRRSLTLLQSQEEIRHLATHDVLTGLPNRAEFERQLDGVLRLAIARGEATALLYLDLDRFKQVNDTLGHPAGDELLRIFAGRLTRLSADLNSVARLSGDEFTIILNNVAAESDVELLCHRIIEGSRHPFELSNNQVFVSVSVGLAISSGGAADVSEITRRADVALYRAKGAGRSGFAIYSPEMDVLINDRRNVERDLRRALEDGTGLEVRYQPQINATSRRLTGVEALVRWRHADRGQIPPDVFIPLAEEAGLIGRIGEFVLVNAVAATMRWPIETVAVNVSALELCDPGYAGRVAAILASAGMEPGRLELEVTESTLADPQGACVKNVEVLRKLGVRFALDDFGTGFSSLGRLQQLEVDRIKIDRSFVQGFGSDNGDEAIVRAIIDLARATGLRTTAEGVETTEQELFLQSIGCDELQGFLFSKPISEEQMAALLSDFEVGTVSPTYGRAFEDFQLG